MHRFRINSSSNNNNEDLKIRKQEMMNSVRQQAGAWVETSSSQSDSSTSSYTREKPYWVD